MYQLNFRNISEIRMGSPYNCATVDLVGDYIPDLEKILFQDIGLLNSKKDTAYLVQWETANNEPGFRVWKIEEISKTVQKSELISGLCQKLALSSNGTTLSVTLDTEGLSKIILLDL